MYYLGAPLMFETLTWVLRGPCLECLQGYLEFLLVPWSLHSGSYRSSDTSFICNVFAWDTWMAQSVKWLPSAQVRISGSWDQAPHLAPCSMGACFPHSACLQLPCLCAPCQINKTFKRKCLPYMNPDRDRKVLSHLVFYMLPSTFQFFFYSAFSIFSQRGWLN